MIRIPILCSDANHLLHGGPAQLGTIDLPDGTVPLQQARAAWGYLCGPCQDARQARFEAAVKVALASLNPATAALLDPGSFLELKRQP